MSPSDTCLLLTRSDGDIWLTYAVIPASLVFRARYGEQGLSIASGFEHPASTLPTRFPAALDIGHGLPAA